MGSIRSSAYAYVAGVLTYFCYLFGMVEVKSTELLEYIF